MSVIFRRVSSDLHPGAALAVLAVLAGTVLARLPGWNPDSLWADDLVYGAIIRSESLWSMIAAPIQVAPGLFIIWRWLYAAFPDPEWSLQLLPFACGIAAIPVMAVLVRRLTQDDGLAVLAASLTALNPLLAHHTVFVRQYTVEFVLTALFLLAAVRLCADGCNVDARRFGRVAFGGALALFFAMPSVFVSFPLVNLGALFAVRGWRHDRRKTLRILSMAAAYDLSVLISYVLLRVRSSDMLRDYYAAGFMALDSVEAVRGFLAHNFRRLLETSLPSWSAVEISNPATVSWPLPFLALGLVWLLARRPTRFFGLAVAGFYAALLVASALSIYPLGTGRPDIFAFPAAICLFAVGIHLATDALPHPGRFRLAAAVVAAAIAVARPLHVEYWNVGDAPLVDYLVADMGPDDGLIVSPGGTFLIAFYGPWPVTVTPSDRHSHGAMAKIGRERTLYLFPASPESADAARFVAKLRPERAWYLAFRTRSTESRVVDAIEAAGYTVHQTLETRRGRLYLALAEP